jgi:S1-C subfamily serine protease
LKFGGIAVENYHHLQRLVADAEVGRTVALGLLRNKQRIEVPVKIGEMPGEESRKARG